MSDKILGVVDPAAAGDKEIRKMLQELLDDPKRMDACVVIRFFKNEQGQGCTSITLRNTSDIELGYMSSYLQAYAARRFEEGIV